MSFYVDPDVIRVFATDGLGIFVGEVDLQVHPASMCFGDRCVIHKPTDHHMREWSLVWRRDKQCMERMCPEHSIGHPDPDDLTYHVANGREWIAVHGCCGCCDENYVEE